MGDYLSGVLVNGNVDDAVVVTALVQDGLMDGEIPVISNLPVSTRVQTSQENGERQYLEAHHTSSRDGSSHDWVKHVPDLQTWSQAVGRGIPAVQREG